MEAKEKAVDLIHRYVRLTMVWDGDDWNEDISSAKQCALICVDEILSISSHEFSVIYWKTVKYHIEKL